MNKKRKTGQLGKALVMITQLSISMITPVVLCTAIGLYLDKHFDTKLTLIFLILGILSGAQSGYRVMKKVLADDAREDSDEV